MHSFPGFAFDQVRAAVVSSVEADGYTCSGQNLRSAL